MNTKFLAFIEDFNVPSEYLGKVVASDFIVDSDLFGSVSFCKDLYDNALASNF